MKNVARFLAVPALFLSAHLFAAETENMVKKNISGEEAKEMINALRRSGVRDIDNKNDVFNLRMKSIQCKEFAVAFPQPICTIKLSYTRYDLAGPNAKIFYKILNNNEGRIGAGLGVRKVYAQSVHCVAPKADISQSQCTFDVKSNNLNN